MIKLAVKYENEIELQTFLFNNIQHIISIEPKLTEPPKIRSDSNNYQREVTLDMAARDVHALAAFQALNS